MYTVHTRNKWAGYRSLCGGSARGDAAGGGDAWRRAGGDDARALTARAGGCTYYEPVDLLVL
eukprot:COSAG02_NODE_3244_length_7106_cov_5.600400_6_plen_62_part_00